MSAPADLPEQSPLEEVAPAGDRPEDMGTLHRERQISLERAERRRRSLERLAGLGQQGAQPGAADPNTPQPAGEEQPGEQGSTAGRVAKDLARGSLEVPGQAAGGFFDAIQNAAGGIKDLADQFSLPGIIYEPGKGIRIASGEEIKHAPGALEKLAETFTPEIEPADTVTGGIARSVAKFATGFLGAGKVAGLGRLSQAGGAAQVGGAAARGALSDFFAFDEDEKRLSNLIQEVPALQNPVTEFLATDPSDSGAVSRLKNAVEGLGVGVAVDGLVKGVKVLRSMRAARAATGVDDTAARAALRTAEAQRARLVELAGDPAQKALDVRAGAKGADAPGEVFVNWSTIGQPDDVKQMIQDLADARGGNIDTARRGVRSWEATKLSAEQLNAWRILGERRVGEALNAEQSVAARELWVRSGAQVKSLAEQVAAGGGELEKVAFRRALAIHNAVQEQVIAARTETARALNAWRIQVGDGADFAGQMEQLRVLAQSDQSLDEIALRVTQLSDAGMAKELDAFLHGAGAAKSADVARQVFYAAMLSSPHTHARNFIGSAASLPMQMLERRVAAWVGKVAGQQNVPDGEAMAQLFGAIAGTRRAMRFTAKGRQVFRAARQKWVAGDSDAARQLLAQEQGEVGTVFRSLLTGETGVGIGRPEAPRGGAFVAKAEHMGIGKDTAFGHVASFLDTATTAPMRALGASDELFKTMAFDMELSAQAFRKASKEVASGTIAREQLADRVTVLLQNPDEYARMAGARFADVSTFTGRPGEWGQAMAKLASKTPVLGRFILPFRSTPFNIASFTFRRTPVAPFVRQWRDDIRAGGAQADIAWAQFLTGSAIMATAADMALKGDITGIGPENAAERQALERTGWQPSSVRVGKNYYSLRGLEPLSTLLNTAANAVDVLRYSDWTEEDSEADELVIATAMAFTEQMQSQSALSGLSAFFEVMGDGQRYGESYFQRLATIPIPRVVGLAARTTDTTVRMATDIGDALRAQTPGLSKSLPPARDLWGRTRSYSSGYGSVYDFLSPVHVRTENAEPIDLELQKIDHFVAMPSKRISINGESTSLRNKPEIYSRYVELAGNGLKLPIFGGEKLGAMDALNALVSGKAPQSRVYDRLSAGEDGDKGRMIDDIVDLYREAARQQLAEDFPELRVRSSLQTPRGLAQAIEPPR